MVDSEHTHFCLRLSPWRWGEVFFLVASTLGGRRQAWLEMRKQWLSHPLSSTRKKGSHWGVVRGGYVKGMRGRGVATV